MKQRNILLVDDDEDDQVLFVDALNQIDNSFRCEVANRAWEAMLSLYTKTLKPDIIFLDLNMREMNAYECMTRNKERSRVQTHPDCDLHHSRNTIRRTTGAVNGSGTFFHQAK